MTIEPVLLNVDYVYFIQGAIMILLFFLLFKRENRSVKFFVPGDLKLSVLSMSLYQLAGIVSISFPGYRWIPVLMAFFFIFSFFSLLILVSPELTARWRLIVFLYAIIFLIITAAVFAAYGSNAARLSFYLILAFPVSVTAAFVFIKMESKVSGERRKLLIPGFSVIIYSFSWLFLFAVKKANNGFPGLAEFIILLFQAAGVIATGVWFFYFRDRDKQKAKRELSYSFFILCMLAFLVGGWFFAGWRAYAVDRDFKDKILSRARGVSNAVDPGIVKKITFTKADADNPDFRLVMAQMKAWGEYTGVKSIYSIARVNGMLIPGPGNTTAKNPIASPSDSMNFNSRQNFNSAFDEALPGVLGPYTDEFGSFASGYSPVIDPVTGKVLLVVAIDMNAAEWLDGIRLARFEVIFNIFAALCLVTVAGVLLDYRNRRGKEKKGILYIHMEAVLILISGLILSFFIFSIIRYFDRKNDSADFTYVSESSAWMIRETLNHIDYDLDDLANYFYSSEDVSFNEFRSFTSVIKHGAVIARGWAPVIRNSQRAGFEKSIRVAGGGSYGIYINDNTGEKVPAKSTGIYYPVMYITSSLENEISPGFDFLSSDKYNKAVLNSLKNGTSVLAGYSTQKDGNRERKIITVLRPVFKDGGSMLQGFVFVSADINQALVYAMSPGRSGNIDINADLLELAPDGGKTIVARYHTAGVTGDETGSKTVSVNNRLRSEYPLFIFDTVFGFRIYRPQNFLKSHFSITAVMGGVSALILTFGLTILTVFVRIKENSLEDEVKLRTGELLESEQRFRILAEASYGGIAVHDNGVIIECNEGLSRMTGYSLHELTGMNGLMLIVPEYREFVMNKILSGDRKKYDSYSLRKDGSIFPIEIQGKSMPYRGKFLRVTEFRDITDRKETEEVLKNQREELEAANEELQAQMEEFEALNNELINSNRQLLEGEEKFSRAFNINPSVMVIIDSETGRYLDVNEAFLGTFGLDRDVVIGKTADELGIVSDITYANRMSELMKSDGKVRNFDVIIHTPRGELIYGLISIDSMLINDAVCSLIVLTDITYRKKFEIAVESSEKKYRLLFETAGDAIFFLENEGIIDCNKKAETMFGCSRGELIGRSPVMFSPEFQPDGSRSGEKVSEKMKAAYAGIPQFFEWTHCKTDGTVFESEVSLNSFEVEETRYIIGIIRDISERKRIEIRLAHMQKMDAIGQLAGGVAHDFNNQLSGVLGYAEILSMRLNDSVLKKYTEGIISAAMRSADLTKKLLVFAHKGQFQLKPVNIHSLVDDTIEMLKHSIDRRISIEKKLYAGAAVVNGDSAQLQNAFLNLGLNARDAMPEGGILTFESEEIHIGDSPRETELMDLPSGNYIAVAVTDSGTGMSAEIRKRLFEPFFTTKESGKGTGMGLASVYGTIKSHSGSINVYSEPGIGSAFRIYLPLIGDGAEYPETREGKEDIHLPGGIILVIDDEEIIRDILSEMLREMGYEVIEAANGKDGVNIYRERWQEIGLVIIDMIMPEVNGHDAFVEMKKINPSIRSILTSGFNVDDEVNSILAEGVLGFIHKPYRKSDLMKKIRDVMNIQL